MRVSVLQYTESNSVFYRVNLDGADPEEEYRARLFLYYDGILSYSGDDGRGLTTNIFGTSYDDWSSEFRPPRIDSRKFNTELDVPLSAGTNEIGFSGQFSNKSESYIYNAVNPVNMLVERKVSEIKVNRIMVTRKEVFLVLDKDIADGTAITVDNISLTEKHLLGEGYMRVCGNFVAHKVSDRVYSYNVKHYEDLKKSVEISADGYTVSVWEAVPYSCGQVFLAKVDSEHAQFAYDTDYVWFEPGDSVLLGKYNCEVTAVDYNKVTVKAVMEEDSVNVPFTYCPRTPSAAVPVNWPTVVVSATRSSAEEAVVDDACTYDHTQNTSMMTPATITYFSTGDDSVHQNDPVAVASRGDVDSVVCMKFAANSIQSDNPSAALHLFIDKMTVSEATIVLYQMDSDGWDPLMSYDEVAKCITNIPVGSVKLENPGMMHVNEGYVVDNGNYGEWVTIDIDSDIVDQWMEGNVSYSPSFAIRVVGEGNQSVSFSTIQYPPHIILTGGESAEVDPFAVELSSDTAEHGQVLRITPADPANHDFGHSIFSNSVEIGGHNAPIVSGDSTYIDVIVPDTVTGSNSVIVYRSTTSTGERVAITDGNTSVYISTELASRNVKLAKKLTPGVVDIDRVGHYAVYNRDFGFVNMKEVTDENSMIQNVYSILLTNPGERLFNNDFGTGIEHRLFTLGSQEDGIDLIKDCIRAVNMYEPRVYIDGEQSSCEFDDSENRYFLLLCVVLPSGNTETIQLPFKNRGKVVK